MPDPHYLLAAVLVATAVTWALRAVPFALLAPIRDSELILPSRHRSSRIGFA